MTPEQRAISEAYRDVFASASGPIVLDDLTVKARTLGEPLERAGAAQLLLHILVQRSALAREKRREPKQASKRTV